MSPYPAEIDALVQMAALQAINECSPIMEKYTKALVRSIDIQNKPALAQAVVLHMTGAIACQLLVRALSILPSDQRRDAARSIVEDAVRGALESAGTIGLAAQYEISGGPDA